MKEDFVYQGRLDPYDIGFTFAHSPALVSNAVVRHDCDPVAAHLLGRALNASLLLTPRLEPHDRLNLHWRYHGECRDVLVDCRGDGRIRGLINPPHLSDKVSDESDIYGGDGHLQVITSRHGKIINSGTAPCSLQRITADLGYYYAVSEQIETALNVMIDFTHDPEHPVSLCQGLMLQALPGCDLERFERLRNRLHDVQARELLGRPSEADGLFEDVLNAVTAEEKDSYTLHVSPGPSPRWFCTCREEKFHTTLRMLPETDRQEIIAAGEPVVVRCDFCNRAYQFDINEAQKIWTTS